MIQTITPNTEKGILPMKKNYLIKFASVFAFSAFVAGSAVAGPAYPSLFPFKKAPAQEARPAQCAMMKAKTKLVTTQAPRPITTVVKVASNRCTTEMLSVCQAGDHTKC